MTRLRKLMLDELERRNYTQTTKSLPVGGGAVREALPPLARPARSRPHPRLSGPPVPGAEVATHYRNRTAGGFAVPVRGRAQAALERRRHALSQAAAEAAHGAQPGRGDPADQLRPEAATQYRADDAVRHRPAARRTHASENHRHRLRPNGDPCYRRQGA